MTCVVAAAVLVVGVLALKRERPDAVETATAPVTARAPLEIDGRASGTGPVATPTSAESEAAAAPHNALPLIDGEPPPFVLQNAPYLFEPDAFDLDADQVLSFSITGKPEWMVFEPSNGALMGVPQQEDVGRYDGIVITVSDGIDTASFGPFSVEVVPSATGTALLTWTPPSDTVDGSAFPGISGYRIEYGQSPSALLQTVNIENAGVTSYIVDNLTPGAWYFRVVVYDTEGLETKPTALVYKMVQ